MLEEVGVSTLLQMQHKQRWFSYFYFQRISIRVQFHDAKVCRKASIYTIYRKFSIIPSKRRNWHQQPSRSFFLPLAKDQRQDQTRRMMAHDIPYKLPERTSPVIRKATNKAIELPEGRIPFPCEDSERGYQGRLLQLSLVCVQSHLMS